MKREPQHYLCHVCYPGGVSRLYQKWGASLFESYEFKGVLATGAPGGIGTHPLHDGLLHGFVCGSNEGIVRVFGQSDDSREY